MEMIEKIKRELEEKQIELDKCTCSLENTTTKLSHIKAKFDNQIQRLAIKKFFLIFFEFSYFLKILYFFLILCNF